MYVAIGAVPVTVREVGVDVVERPGERRELLKLRTCPANVVPITVAERAVRDVSSSSRMDGESVRRTAGPCS